MKHTRYYSQLLALAVGSLLASGCLTVTTDTNPFQPLGTDVSLSGQWDVDGAAPNASSCGNIARVRVAICQDASGSNCQTSSALTFPCANGAFDTRPSGVLASGSYHVVWEALSASNAVLQESTPSPISAISGHVVLPTPNFTGTIVAGFDPSGTDVSLDGIWDVNGDVPTVQSCGDITQVRVVVCEDAAGVTCWTSPSLTFPCANGAFDTRPTRVLAAGSYFSLWEALDASGNVLQESSILPLSVTTHATLATPDFDGVLPPTSVTVQVRFQDAAAGPFVTCSAANIASNQFTYVLHEGSELTDPIIVPTTVQNCNNGSDISFNENASFQFDTGSYTLSIAASENVGGCMSFWDAKCTFNLTLNQTNVVTCNATISSSGGGC